MSPSEYARQVAERQAAYQDTHGGAYPRTLREDGAIVPSESGPADRFDSANPPKGAIFDSSGEVTKVPFDSANPPKGSVFDSGGPVTFSNEPAEKRKEYAAWVQRQYNAAQPLPAPAPPTEGLGKPASSELLDNLNHVSFDYKPGQGPPGRTHGIIAQDLEKSPMGQTLIAQPDASGVKKVDLTKATMANLAVSADLHKRLKAVEGERTLDADAYEQEHGIDLDAHRREEERQNTKAVPLPIPAGSESDQRGSELGMNLGGGGLPLQGAIAAADRQGRADNQERQDNQDGAKSLFTRNAGGRGDAPIATGENGRVLRGLTGQRGDFFDPGVASSSGLIADNRSEGQTQRALDKQGILRMKATQGQEMNPEARKRVFGKNQEWVEAAAAAARPAPKPMTYREQVLAKQAQNMGRSMDAQFNAPNAVASDEVVKDDIRREDISPQDAYASRVRELMDMAKQGHPEAPRKLERLEREGSAVGLGGSQNPAGNLLGTDSPLAAGQNFLGPKAPEAPPPAPAAPPPDTRPTVAAQLVKKAYKATIGRDVAPPRPEGDVGRTLFPNGAEAKEDLSHDSTMPKADNEPFTRVEDKPVLAGADQTQGPVLTPKASDAAAEREQGPAPAEAPSSTTVPARYQDMIGPEAWAALDDSHRAAITAAQNISDRMLGQSAKEQNAAERQSVDADIRASIAMDGQRDAETRGKDLEAQANDILGDAKHLANYHEDSNHFWKTRSTAQTIAAYIGIALGGFAAGMNGGPNHAQDQINRMVDQDVSDQRAAYNAKKDSLVVKRSAYGMAMERYGHDDNKATTAVRLAALDKVDAQARLAAAQHRGADTANELDKFLAGTSKLRADEIINFKKYHEARTVQNGMSMDTLNKEFGKYYASVTEKGEQPMPFAQWAHGRMGGVVPGSPWGGSADRHAAAEEKRDAAAEKQGERTFRMDGNTYVATSKEAATKNKDSVKAANEAIHAIDEINRINATPEYANTPNGRAELNQHYSNLSLGYPRSQTDSNRLNESEIQIGRKSIAKHQDDWIKGDYTGATKTGLNVVRQQLVDRKKEIEDGSTLQGGASSGTSTPSTFKASK